MIKRIILADSRLGPVYLSKVDLTGVYMGLWVRVKNTPVTVFIIPKKNKGDDKSLGFHLSLPMGVRESTPFFCMSTDTVVDMENATVLCHFATPPHLLEAEAGHQTPEDADVISATSDSH